MVQKSEVANQLLLPLKGGKIEMMFYEKLTCSMEVTFTLVKISQKEYEIRYEFFLKFFRKDFR